MFFFTLKTEAGSEGCPCLQTALKASVVLEVVITNLVQRCSHTSSGIVSMFGTWLWEYSTSKETWRKPAICALVSYTCEIVSFMQNLPRPQGPQIVGKTLFWMYLWVCFLDEFNIWIPRLRIRLLSLMWVGPMQSAEDLDRTKRLVFLWGKRGFFLPDGVWAGVLFLFLPSDSNWNISWISSRVSTLELPGCPASWLQIQELTHLHSHVGRYPITNEYIYISNWFYFSGEP